MWIMVNNTGTAIVVLGQWKGHGSYHNSSDKVCGEQRGVIFAALASCCHCVVSQQRFSFLRTNTYVTSKPSLRGLLGFLQQKLCTKPLKRVQEASCSRFELPYPPRMTIIPIPVITCMKALPEMSEQFETFSENAAL